MQFQCLWEGTSLQRFIEKLRRSSSSLANTIQHLAYGCSTCLCAVRHMNTYLQGALARFARFMGAALACVLCAM